MFDDISSGPLTTRMPVFFIGHGSPMNAIDANAYTGALNRLPATFEKPRAILVVSAHWMTNGTWVTETSRPKTIHDFYGFPRRFFDVQYPAPGDVEIARSIRQMVVDPVIHADTETWGLDHGTWAVLRHMYPDANVPVLQLSLDLRKPPQYHVDIGRQLSRLRDRGVLILGSGNLVHNLQQIRWEPSAKPHDWALEYDEWLKRKLIDRDFGAVLNDFHQTTAGKLSVPTLDHYFPLHYILGAADERDELRFEYEEMQNSSISMRSFRLG